MKAPNDTQEKYDKALPAIIAVAASAGGLNALTHLLSNLPADFPVAVLVVQHLAPHHKSLMAEILGRRTLLKVKQAEEGDCLKPARVYIAPPNYHLLVKADETLRLTQTDLVNFVRPSADLLFESVALTYRERAIVVVLSGTGHDGRQGVEAVKRAGGTVIVQDENSSEFFGMPGSVIEAGTADFILPLDAIAPKMVELVLNGCHVTT
jgi:two-component system chemotaxis response regulator CheB